MRLLVLRNRELGLIVLLGRRVGDVGGSVALGGTGEGGEVEGSEEARLGESDSREGEGGSR